MTAAGDAAWALSPIQRELAQLWLEQAPPEREAEPRADPANAMEEALVEVWREVLQAESLGVEDDYFGSGGDSITAIVVIAKARQAGLEITTQDLLNLRTVRKIVAAMAADQAAVAAAVEGRPSDVDGKLTPMQEGMLADVLRDHHSPRYVVQVHAGLEGDVNAEDLAAAWQWLVQRHPALRVAMQWDATRLRQVVHAEVVVPVHQRDLRGLPAGVQQAAVAEYLSRDFAAGFELDRPPLLRIGLITLGEGRCRLVLTHHHLLLDGWSQQIVLRELLDHYDGKTVAPPVAAEPPEQIETETGYWRERLAGFVPAPTVPVTDQSGLDVDRFVTRVAGIPEGLGEALAGTARRVGVTVPVLFYGGWALLVAAIAGRDDIACGITVSGRRPGAAEAVGMFINTLPLRVSVRRDSPVAQWLARLHRRQVELLERQHTPLTEIARSAGVSAGAQALFDTIVVVENFAQPVGEGTQTRRLRVSDVGLRIVEGYPMVLEVRTGPALQVSLRADTAHVTAAHADTLLAMLVSYLERLDEIDETATVGDLIDHIGPAPYPLAGNEAPDGELRRSRRRAADPVPEAGHG